MHTKGFFSNFFLDTVKRGRAANKIAINLLFIASVSIVVSACGGSSGGGGTDPVESSILSGTASTGAAIAGQVYVYGSGGLHEVQMIDASGHYEIDISGLQAPYLIAVRPLDPNIPWQYSYASTAGGVTNVTPLTTLALFIATGQRDLLDLINWDVEYGSFSAQDINDAQAIIRANFGDLYAQFGLDPLLDFFTLSFNADGAGLDGVLDTLAIDIDMTSGTFLITENGAPFVFDMSANTGATGGNFGSLAVSGTYQEILANPSFEPVTYEVMNATDFNWTDNANSEALIVAEVPDDSSKAWSVTFSNGWTTVQRNELNNYLPAALPGVAVTANTVTFTDFAFTVMGESVVILNGTLNRP